ncbi:papilin-like [Hyposmocoma kahamanoa]|uniref:papilin-like n=1 Tax=Hyposmocoma kahamanoa TaxID=1477025 RepID=UPI000E6D6A4A|nr:papilin-like [Hyposmocoma kahamanoa]
MKTCLFSSVLLLSVVTTIRGSTPDFCKLLPNRGPCDDKIDRYYWNNVAKTCSRFTYGGCDGNANNFKTLSDCHRYCNPYPRFCNLQSETGPCAGAFLRYFWNDTAKECQKFSYGGCDGNKNNFETFEACNGACNFYPDACRLAADSGPCLANGQRYYWNDQDKKCEKFVYGGCYGNPNNFASEEVCQKTCNPYPGACTLRPDDGTCKENSVVTRYFWNETTQNCQKFTYSGCGGNANNFRTEMLCQENCNPYPKLCTLEAEPGPCRGAFKRFFWNNDEKECQEFIYGGCQGNNNNFETLQACRDTCDTYPGSCQLEPNSGPCQANDRRYYWNKTARKCQLFPYGGCFGNQNNFKTKEVCLKTCALIVPTCR